MVVVARGQEHRIICLRRLLRLVHHPHRSRVFIADRGVLVRQRIVQSGDALSLGRPRLHAIDEKREVLVRLFGWTPTILAA